MTAVQLVELESAIMLPDAVLENVGTGKKRVWVDMELAARLLHEREFLFHALRGLVLYGHQNSFQNDYWTQGQAALDEAASAVAPQDEVPEATRVSSAGTDPASPAPLPKTADRR